MDSGHGNRLRSTHCRNIVCPRSLLQFSKYNHYIQIDKTSWTYGMINGTYHFIIDFVEVDFTDFVHNVLVLVGDEAEAPMSVGLLVEHQHHILNLYQRNCHSVSRSI